MTDIHECGSSGVTLIAKFYRFPPLNGVLSFSFHSCCFKAAGIWKKWAVKRESLNPKDFLHFAAPPPSLSMSRSHTNANTPFLAGGLPPSSGLNDIIGCQGYKDTACREKGGWGIGRAIHIAWKRKQETGILGIKKEKKKLGRLVETSSETMRKRCEEKIRPARL